MNSRWQDKQKLLSILRTGPRRTAFTGASVAALAGTVGLLRRTRESARKLRESEERFALAVRGADDGLWDWNLLTDEVYFSPRWKSVLGYEDHELPNRFQEWRNRVHPDDLPRAMRAIQEHLDGRSPYYELDHRLLHKDGSYRWIHARGTSIRDSHGRPCRLAGAHWDITERKQAETALQRRDAILEAVRFTAERFLEDTRNWEESIHAVLGRLGAATEVSRASIFQNEPGQSSPDGQSSPGGVGELLVSRRHQWTAPGVSIHGYIADNQTFAYRRIGFDRWEEELSQGRLLYGNVRDFPESEQRLLLADGYRALIVVPIFVRQAWWGFLALSDNLNEREWSAPEIDALVAAASTLGSAIYHKHVEEELASHRDSLAEAQRIAHLGSITWDIRARRQGWSEETFLILGYDPGAFTPQNGDFLNRVHPDDRERVAQTLESALDTGEDFTYDCRLLLPDGTERYIHGEGEVVTDPAGIPLRTVGTIQDISERKATEEELRESETRFRSLVDQNLLGIRIYSPDGRTIYANQAYMETAGSTEEQLYSGNVFESEFLIRKGLMSYVQRGFSGEVVELPPVLYTPEDWPSIKEGRPRWLRSFIYPVKDDSGELRAVIAMHEDVTESMLAEERLRETEDQYRRIFEETSDGVVITSPEGVLVEANPAMCRMHGYTREEFLQLHPTQFIVPEHHYLFAEYINTVMAGGEFKARAMDLRKDGTPFHVEVRGSLSSYGNKPHVLGVVRDVSAEVEAYELLETRVRKRTQELSSLLEVSRTVASTLELKPLLGSILDGLKAVVDYKGCLIFELEADDQFSILQYRGPFSLDQMARWDPPILRPPLSAAYAEVVRTRAPVIIDDLQGDSPLARAFQQVVGKRLTTTFGYVRSWLGVPLIVGDRVIGGLGLSYDVPNYYQQRHSDLALAVASQAAVAIENARLYERTQAAAALEERQKLARELHDSVSQALYGIALGARTARTLLDRDPTQVAGPLDYVLSLAEAGLAEMRALIFELRPESLETEGLVVALDKQTASLRVRHNIAVTVAVCDEPDMPLDHKEALYRIAQEALHNTVKHSHATAVELRLACGQNEVTLEVSDNGKGFDPEGSYPGHLGLRSMRERAARVGGSLEIRSAPGQGVTLIARVPYRRTGSPTATKLTNDPVTPSPRTTT